MKVPTHRILPVFFAAMQDGYAGNAKKSTITELPNSKVITFKQGRWTVVDCYFVTPLSNFSFGTTIIYYDDVPVWMMHYWGEYPKEVIPFLKQALRANYEFGRFEGGRGPRMYSDPDNFKRLEYFNFPEHNDNPLNFKGREEIKKYGLPLNRIVGWHEYSGQLLLPVNKKKEKKLVLSPEALQRIKLMSVHTRKPKDHFVD